VIYLTGPDKSDVKYPTEDELLKMFRKASATKVTAKEEEVSVKQLIPKLPKPGSIVSEKEDPLFGVTVFTLSNGVKAIVKQTEYKKDQILMTATSPGGLTLFKSDKDIWNKKAINNVTTIGGLGEFSATALRKALTGKRTSLSAGIGDENENLNGATTPTDLKTLFELIYLQMTAVRIDDEAYKSFDERIRTQLETQQSNPMVAFSDTLTDAAYDGNPRTRRMKASDFDKVDYHRMIEMYRERYADASDFVFTFVGNVSKDAIRPLLKQYLATLPSLNRKEKGDESQITPFHKGKVSKHFKRNLETPKTSIALLYSGKMTYNLRELTTAQLLSNVLDLVFLEKVRDAESATYDVRSNVALYSFPEGRTTIQIFCDTDPGKSDKVLKIIKSALEDMASNGPTDVQISKSVKGILRGREEIMQENEYWLKAIDTYYTRGFDAHTEFNKTLNSITKDEIKRFAKDLLSQGNLIEVVMSSD